MSKSFNEIINDHSTSDIHKFNPYHGPDGRFTTSGAATSFTYAPGKSKAHDLAIAREKERHAAMAAAEGPGNKKLSLNEDNIRRANDNSMMGTAGTTLARAAQQRVDQFKEEFKEKGDWTDEQKAYVKQRQDEYTELVSEYYNDQIRRSAENVSWVVAGPANYNVRASERKFNAQRNKADEYEQKLSNFKENTYRKLKTMEPEEKQIAYWRNGKFKNGETIDASDPLFERKMQAKIDYLTENQQKMKDANAYYRRNGSMQGFEGFSDKTNAKLDSYLKDNAYGDKKPFASYSLSNNNAQIKAAQNRLSQVQSQKAKAAQNGGSGGGKAFNGGTMKINNDINRLQLIFDGKPSAEVRDQLKANGFRWSPTQGAWQRQNTPNAERAAERIMESLNKSYSGTKAVSFSEVRKFNPYHGPDGRFTTSGGATSFTYKPGASRAHDLAIAREKERHADAAASDGGKQKIAEAETKIKSMLKEGAEVKLEGMDPECASDAAESIKMVLDKYPTVKDAFEGFTTDEVRNGWKETTMAAYDPSTKKIHFNNKYYSNKQEFEKKYNDSVDKQHSPAGTTTKSVVVHEMGHAIDRYVSLKTIDYWHVMGGETVSSRIWNSDIRAAKKKGEPMSGKSIRENLSGYASKNHHEYFAEAFSEAMTSPTPRKTAQSIVKRMETYIKKAAKAD